MLGKRGSVRVWWTHVWKVSHVIIEDYKIRFIYSPGWQEHWSWQAKLTCHEATCFIAPKGVTWTCRVCWIFFLAMAMWQGRLRENVCDWRLRRSDWNSGMNAAEYILCASLCQRMCKISFWGDKRNSQHKKINGMKRQSFDAHSYSENIGTGTVSFFERLHGCWFHGIAITAGSWY